MAAPSNCKSTTVAATSVRADLVVRMEPDKYVANMAKAKRTGKIYIDYLRNGQGASAIASYSTRWHPHAPVATPISWDELSRGVQPSTFTTETVPRRMARLTEDPWADYFELQQAVTRRLDGRCRWRIGSRRRSLRSFQAGDGLPRRSEIVAFAAQADGADAFDLARRSVDSIEVVPRAGVQDAIAG
jgi:hypothetical protein